MMFKVLFFSTFKHIKIQHSNFFNIQHSTRNIQHPRTRTLSHLL